MQEITSDLHEERKIGIRDLLMNSKHIDRSWVVKDVQEMEAEAITKDSYTLVIQTCRDRIRKAAGQNFESGRKA